VSNKDLAELVSGILKVSKNKANNMLHECIYKKPAPSSWLENFEEKIKQKKSE